MIRSWYLEHSQDPEVLITLLNKPGALNAKINEALYVWNQHVLQMNKR